MDEQLDNVLTVLRRDKDSEGPNQSELSNPKAVVNFLEHYKGRLDNMFASYEKSAMWIKSEPVDKSEVMQPKEVEMAPWVHVKE